MVTDWVVGRKTRRAVVFVSPCALFATVLSRIRSVGMSSCSSGKELRTDDDRPESSCRAASPRMSRSSFLPIGTVRNFVSSSFRPKQKKPGRKSRASSRKLRKGRSSERSSERSPRRRTRLFSYLDPSRSKDFALLEYVMFS